MDNLEKIGKILSEIRSEIPEGLSQKVIFIVQKRESRVIKMKMLIFGLASSISVVLLYFAAKTAVGEFYSSGTSQMLSLLFSDFQSVVANISNYLMSIAESFPVLSAVYVLLSFGIFGIFFGFEIANIQKLQGLKLNYLKHGYKYN